MAEFITGDAFKEDRISEKIYGLPITSGNHSVTFSGKEETPEPMCNTVSFMKTETLNSHCRNVVAVSESYICYTVKKTKLRAIHTESSKLALFQGHDFPLVDLKFSQVDRSFLCSVDDSIGAELPFPVTPRVIIRQLKFDLELTSTVLAQFPISATMVDPHPKIAHVFAIAKGNRVGVVSGMQKIGGKDSWDGLTLNTIMPANITDISFSTDGTQLVVVTAANGQSDVAIISLPGMEQLSLGEGKLVKSEQRRLHAETVWSDILSVICLPCGILTASRVASVSESAIKGVRTVQLQLLSTDSTTGYMDIIQSIKVTIPVHSSASIDESNNDIKLAFKKRVGDGTDFVILCHRSSHILACIAVDVRRRQLPLCHLTFFDLKWPVFSLDSTIISGRNYYSDEEVDHLEIACYQVQDSKHAVHQYHFHCSSLYSIEATEHESEKNSNMTRKFSGQSILEILKTPSHIVSADSFSSESYATSSNFDIPVGTVRPVTAPRLVENIMKSGSISEELVWSDIEAKNAQTQINRSSHQTVESEQKELPPLPEILRSNAVQGRSIMSMLTKLNTVKTAEPVLVASTAALVPASLQAFIPVPVSTRVSASIPTITSLPNSVPDVTTSAPVARVSDSNESSKSDVSPGTVARLMSGLYETLFTEVIPVSEVQVPASTVVVVTPTQQRSETVEFEVVAIEQDEEDDWQDASAAVAMTARRSPLTAPTLVGRDALDLALQKSKIQVPSQQQSFGQQSYHVDTSLHDKINDLTKGMYSLVECVSDIKSSTASTTTNRISQLFDQLDAKTAKRDIEAKQEVERAIKSLRGDMINEMKSALDASFIKSQREMQAFKAEIVAVSISHAKENTLAITKTVKSILDSEMKKSIEDVLKSKAWRDLLLSQMVETIQTDLTPILTQKVKESVKDAVRDTVKAALASSFRTAFESSLLPAFQAGTDRMFAQVQASFDQGMKGLVDQGRASRECSDECTIEMSREVAALRSTVSMLETKIDLLMNRPSIVSAAVEVSPPLPDPVELFKSGNILEAVECALELRDIVKLVTLLELMSPTQLVTNCNKLVQLCTAHQLAEDLASKLPLEGISKRLEWLNSLIFGLLFSGSSPDTSATEHLKPVFADIAKFLSAAESSVISQIGLIEGSADGGSSYVPTTIDFKYLTISVSGVNFDKSSGKR